MKGDPMFLEHFSLREQPFGATPDPRFLYFSPQHVEALSALHYGLIERRGLLVLTAAPGLGKTTLLYHLIDMWKDRAETAFVFQPPQTREQMIAAVLEDLGLASTPGYHEGCHLLYAMAAECRRKGKRVLLVFDEAQAIPPEVLEEIRLLSNCETPEEKLIEIILAGQPALAERLSAPEHEQLRQRVAIWATLGPLAPSEVRRYLSHRLRIAGRGQSKLFSGRSVDLLAQVSAGVPRTINALCFQALSACCAAGGKRIQDDDIRDATLALYPFQWAVAAGARRRPRLLRWVAAAAIAALAVAIPARRVSHQLTAPAPVEDLLSPVVVSAAPPAAAPVPAPEPAPPLIETVRVEPSHTLRGIALRKYGRWDPQVWQLIKRGNPWLRDPDLLQAGQILALPPWKTEP